MVPMRDGRRLYTEVFLPEQDTRFPVVLIRSPYPYSRPSRNDKLPVGRYLAAGYAVVFQLTRGQYKSEGVFHYLQDDAIDGYDCIDWLEKQTWCNGQVGMEGPSYLGAVQLLAAREQPPALKCIMPTAFVGSPFTTFPFIGGIPFHCILLQWFQMVDAEGIDCLDAAYGDTSISGHPDWHKALFSRPLIDAGQIILSGDKLESWTAMLRNIADNDFWKPIQFSEADLHKLDLPIFFTDGWYDLTIGPIDYFCRLEQILPARDDRYLLVGPWNHAQTYVSESHAADNGDRQMPEAGNVDLLAQRLLFYDRYLKGITDNVIQAERVRVFITGAGIWKDYPTFPAPGTVQRCLYLHSRGNARVLPGDGWLDDEPPGCEAPDTYTYDPAVATPGPITMSDYFSDRRAIEIRSDVLAYTSKPLPQPLAILGESQVILYVSSDAADTDWFVTLTEVYPDGRSIPFDGTIPALRSRFRQGFDKEVLLTPNQPVKLTIKLGPSGHQLAAGNRLRLAISSACFPLFCANTNTGNPVATDTQSRGAKQTVFHDDNRASRLILPTITL